MTTTFGQLKNGDKFTWEGSTWVKFKKKKNCCKLKYNAHLLGNKNSGRLFKANVEVEKIG